MKRLIGLVVSVCLTVLLISSCGGGGTSSGTVSVTGYWTGWWTSSTGESGSLTVSLTSIGSTFSGPVIIGNSDCFGYESAVGTMDGSTVTLGVSSNAIIFIGTVGSNSIISGMYEVSGGDCYGDYGVFSISK